MADQAAVGASRGRGRSTSGTAAPSGASAEGEANYASPDLNLWAYFQHLENKVKNLTSQLEAEIRNKTQLLEKLDAHEQQIANLSSEVARLRQQVLAPQNESDATGEAAAAPAPQQ